MNKKLFILFGIILVHLFLLVKAQFTLWPEIISSPYFILHSFALYTDFIHPYPPLLPLFLALFFKVFGFNVFFLKLIVWASILASDWVIYLITKQLKIPFRLQAIGLGIFIFLQTFLDGNMLWYDTALTLPLLLLIYYYVKRNWNAAVIFLICMALIKQSSVFVFISFLIILFFQKRKGDILKTLALTVLVANGVVCALYLQGTLESAYKWILLYPSTFWTKFPGYVQLSLTKRDLFSLILVSISPLVLIGVKRFRWVSAVYFACLLAVYPRFSFFHLQPALAVAAVSFIIVLSFIKKHLILVCIFVVFSTIIIITPSASTIWGKETRFYSIEQMNFANEIHEHVPKDSVIYFLNIPSNLYFLTTTLPPKPWLDNYGWYFEVPGQQADVIKQWSKSPPQYIVWKEKGSGNWYDIGVYEPQTIVSWIKSKYKPEWQIQSDIWIWKLL